MLIYVLKTRSFINIKTATKIYDSETEKYTDMVWKINRNLSDWLRPWDSVPHPAIFWKKSSKTFGKMQFHCIFCKSICDIFKVFPLVGKMSRSDRWGENNINPLIKVLIKRIKFNFFQMEKWDLQELFYRKSSLHLQKSL